MFRMGVVLACSLIGSLSCQFTSLSSPAAPSIFSGPKSALLCAGANVDFFDFLGGGECASTNCVPHYNAQFFHRCSDGWPDPQPGGTSVGVIRVRVSVAAFQGDEEVWTDRVEFYLAQNESWWLCGGSTREDCRIEVEGEKVEQDGLGLGRHWNSCWVEYRPATRGTSCFPDLRYPDFPSAADVALNVE